MVRSKSRSALRKAVDAHRSADPGARVGATGPPVSSGGDDTGQLRPVGSAPPVGLRDKAHGGDKGMTLRRGALLALLAGTWSAAALAEDHRRTRPARAMRLNALPNFPQSFRRLAGPTRQGASSKDASRITAASLPIGRWPTGGR